MSNNVNYHINIIIPVYNRQQLIRPCIESVIGQSYSDFTAIVIDDGSNDDTGNILDEYAKKDNRIKVYHQANAGIAGARNAGLDAALADDFDGFIMFLDSDDMLEKDAMEKIITIAKESRADIVQWQAHDFNSNADDLYDVGKREDYEHAEILTDSKGALYTLLDTKGRGADSRFHLLWNDCRCVWTKCCKTKVYKDVRCPKDKAYEDDFIVDKLFANADRIVFTNDSNTNYRRHSSNFLMKKNWKDRLDHTECERERFTHACQYNEDALIRLAAHNVIMSTANSFVYIYGIKEARMFRKSLFNELKSVMGDRVKLIGAVDKLIYYGFLYAPDVMNVVYRAYRKVKG